MVTNTILLTILIKTRRKLCPNKLKQPVNALIPAAVMVTVRPARSITAKTVHQQTAERQNPNESAALTKNMPFGIYVLSLFLQNMPFGIYTNWFSAIKFRCVK
jgi:hypothetical protein